MKLTEQVCTLEQAKRLKELGVEQNSLFYWGEWSSSIHYHENFIRRDDKLSAFTVAELGLLLPFDAPRIFKTNNGYEFTKTGESDWTNWTSCQTEAQARAAQLIHILESKLSEATQ